VGGEQGMTKEMSDSDPKRTLNVVVNGGPALPFHLALRWWPVSST
jgi:hypothetical protein